MLTKRVAFFLVAPTITAAAISFFPFKEVLLNKIGGSGNYKYVHDNFLYVHNLILSKAEPKQLL